MAVVKGYRAALAKAHGPRAEPRRGTAASRNTIAAMIGTLDTSTLTGKRDKAIITVGFAIAGRRGKIAGLNIEGLEFRPGHGVRVQVYRGEDPEWTTR
jgi:hypothetical protein